MTIRATPLLVAPDDADNMFGKSMSSDDLIRGLRRVNKNLVVPAPEDKYRMPEFKGITSLWLGPPKIPGSNKPAGTKICAFHMGAIPEWTQLDEDGVMITRGWRAIFWKLVSSKAVRKAALEREFRVSLDHVADTSLCAACVRQGVREPHNGGVRKMCYFHDDLHSGIAKGKNDAPELKNEAKWKQTKAMFT